MRTSIAALVLAAGTYAQAEPRDPPPLDLDLEEHVGVELVLIDALVLDHRDRAVAGLEAADFEVLVDDRRVEIETFDAFCHGGDLEDPPVGATRLPDPPPSLSPRRYVFVVDYYHLGATAVDVLGRVREAVLRLARPGEEYMVMSLGQTLRIEMPFTTDSQQVVATVERMMQDRDLYFGYYERLTERRWYDRLLTLLDLMEQEPGAKAIVLFSGPLLADGWDYDGTFERISAMASRSRSAFYPVDTRGLTPFDDFMGPRSLRRLAVETGGRATAGTNDLARAFARAQRDLGCQYTIGFHDRSPRLDRERKVRLFVRDRGYRVLHPTHYVIRSPRSENRSWTTTAARVPAMFENEGLEVDLRWGPPVSETRWAVRAEVVIDSARLQGAPEGARVSVRVQLRKPNGTLHRGLRRESEIELPWPLPHEALVVVEDFEVWPGAYDLQVVVSAAHLDRPLALERPVSLPPIPD